MSILASISNGSRTCDGNGNKAHRRWQASILLGSAILYLLFVAVVPITNFFAASAKFSNNWSEPQSGWLYVLDPEVEDGKSVVWLVDPGEGVKGGLKAGDAPFFALSPDGSRLYVVSGHPGPTGTGVFSDELWAIDTASGVLLQQIKLSNRLTYTLPAPGGLAVSPDGRFVYVGKSRSIRPGVDAQTIQTFDTMNSWTREVIVKTTVPFSDLVLSADGRYLYGISPQTRTLLTIDPGTARVEASVGGIGRQPRFLAIAP